jgi:ATP/maltotriose-dependent transcriptional regulator MalT
LRGEFDAAEESYRLSTKWGHDPQPGLAMLRLAQGQLDAALASIRRVIDATADRVTRSRILSAYIEIVLAGGDVAGARAAAGDLSTIAAAFDTPFLHASSAYATGAVLLAEGDARAANVVLRRALTTWRDLEAPYEEARTRVLIGRACRELEDDDAAQMELEAARLAFAELGALPDLSHLEEMSSKGAQQRASGLTWREVQVLSLVATGKSNREVAADLVISERTVARHVSNIFTKLGLASRSAATAYAYEHHLV